MCFYSATAAEAGGFPEKNGYLEKPGVGILRGRSRIGEVQDVSEVGKEDGRKHF